ncbi:MAG: DUF2141 domain-containing protein [Novosphingobium sp.]
MKRLALGQVAGLVAASALLIGAKPVPSHPDLGKAEGQCRPHETGPAFMVEIAGLKDRSGRLKLEVYPAVDDDFLADDNILINQGKTFRRVEVAVPGDAVPRLCVRLPSAGAYALTVLHDRDADRKFGLSVDGVAFSRNPKLGLSKPKAAAVRIDAGPGITPTRIVMNYRKGLLSFGPLAAAR